LEASTGGKPQEDQTTVDNRERLKDLYQKQAVVNANGTLAFAANNSYTGGTTVSSGAIAAQNPADFNANWITRNNLNNDVAVAQIVAQPNGPAVPGGAPPGPSYQPSGAQYSPPGAQAGLVQQGAGNLVVSGANTFSGSIVIGGGMRQNANPNFAGGRIILNGEQQFGVQGDVSNTSPFAQSRGGGMGGMGGGIQDGRLPAAAQMQMDNAPAPAQQAYGRRGAARDDQQQELAEYKQKLALSKNASQPQAGFVEQNAMETVQSPSPASGVSASTSPVPPGLSPQAAALQQDLMVVTVTPTAPAGLASLDFDLPTDKNLYEVFRFTTPRGEAELTARTASNSAIGKLEFLAGIAAASLVIWAALWLIRRGVLGWFCRPLGATLLAVVGLASLCGGVLPFAGLIAMLAGIGLLVASFWGRRALAA